MTEPEKPPKETLKERWLRIYEPITGKISGAQEEVVRMFAYAEGYLTLRGYYRHIATEEWDFYEILRLISPAEG